MSIRLAEHYYRDGGKATEIPNLMPEFNDTVLALLAAVPELRGDLDWPPGAQSKSTVFWLNEFHCRRFVR